MTLSCRREMPVYCFDMEIPVENTAPIITCNIYTTVFRVKRLNNRTRRVRLFNRLTRKTVV